MSLEYPNEYEVAIENYGTSVRRQHEAERLLEIARKEYGDAINDRKAKWRVVSVMVNQKKIVPGIYHLHKGPGQYADGLLIEEYHDYPELFQMFR